MHSQLGIQIRTRAQKDRA